MKNRTAFRRKTWKPSLLLFVIMFILSLAKMAGAQNAGFEDKVQSPYFIIRGGEAYVSMPLKRTEANVTIAGVIAGVTVKQVWQDSPCRSFDVRGINHVHGMMV